MIDEIRIKEAKANFKVYLDEELIKKDIKISEFKDFFIYNSEMSLKTASVMFDISASKEAKNKLNLNVNFECFLWVLVCSYYSMFYMAIALLSKEGFKIGDKIPHKVTEDSLIALFIDNKKLAKLLEDFEVSKEEALELIGKEDMLKKFQMRAENLMTIYNYERKNRNKFQYGTGILTKQNNAFTSLERAKNFFEEIRKIL